MSSTASTPRLVHSLPPVYAAAALRLALPLVVLPLVASRVGPQEFGRLSFILVWAGLLAMIVEGGFLAAAARWASSGPPVHPWVDAIAIAVLAVAPGWPATWYLQATQQLNRWARVELM